MKINGYYNDIRTLVLYDENAQKENTINPYTTKAYFDTKNIFGEQVESWDDYYKFYISNLVECKNNPTHIKAKQKKGLCFVVWVAGHYSIEGVLYIPFKKVLKHEVIEEKKDMRNDGCINVSYNDKVVFDSDIKIVCKDSEIYFAKGSDNLRNQRDEITPLWSLLEKERGHLEKHPVLFSNARRLIELYESKKKDGFEYRCISYRSIERDYKYLMLYNCVDHYEKTPEYVKAEKLTKDLKAICKHWDTDDTIKLLRAFKLTKKRATKKGE